MDINFKFDGSIRDVLTWDDLEIIEETQETGRVGKAKNILARFVVDEQGKPVPHDKAKKLLGSLTITQIETTLASFSKLLQGEAVSPPTAAS